ncbi:MAG: hypothetical protein RL141_603 [Candidatus Parcubacteria bacterium]|jgi:hypothetical protein
MKQNDVTTAELFEAMSAFSEEMTRQFAQCVKKEDLKGFATKDDLKAFATKEDLKRFVTKEDFREEFNAFKKEMRDFRDDIRQEVGKLVRFLPPVIHKEDGKLNALMERLVQRRVLARADIKDLLEIHPLLS